MKYYVLLFDKENRDNILKVISEPVSEREAEKIKKEQNALLDLSKEYADVVPVKI